MSTWAELALIEVPLWRLFFFWSTFIPSQVMLMPFLSNLPVPQTQSAHGFSEELLPAGVIFLLMYFSWGRHRRGCWASQWPEMIKTRLDKNCFLILFPHLFNKSHPGVLHYELKKNWHQRNNVNIDSNTKYDPKFEFFKNRWDQYEMSTKKEELPFESIGEKKNQLFQI